ncbi:MAG: DUF438 domain-containing protein [Planctomycetota bacterium]
MNKHNNNRLAEELTNFLLELAESKDKNILRKQANRLIKSISPKDFACAEDNLIRNGIPPQKIHQLSTSFIMMGLLDKEKSDLRSQLPDYHVLRKVMAEHDMLRCFLADLEDIAERIHQASRLKPTSSEFMRLSHIVEHLNSLEEHIGREDDVLFPALQQHGWRSMFSQIESEHTYIQIAVSDLIKLVIAFEKMPLETFKNRLMSTVRYLCPLLRKHLFHEDRVLFPLAVSIVNNDKLWERLRHICNEIDYCGIHL